VTLMVPPGIGVRARATPGPGPSPPFTALLPMTIVTGSMAFLSGPLVNRIGEWTAIVVGLTAGAGGALLIALAAAGGVATLIASSLPVGVTAFASQR
jgi:hypothetical protein